MTTPTLTTQQIGINILNKIKSAQTILVVCSKPIDPDSLGTALAFKIWLEQIGKEVTVINSFRLSEDMKNFPSVDQINFNQENPDLNKYDLVITLDSSIWSHLFINKEIVSKQNLEKFIHIDHHFPGEISEDIPQTTLRETLSSTAEVFYTYFLADNYKITPQMATYLYLALVGDTGNFKWAIGPNTMKFADTLIKAGADLQLVESFFKPTENALKYSEWARSNIEHYPELGIELFVHTPEKVKVIEELLQTEYWQDFNGFFVNTFFDNLDSKYNYFITLRPDGNQLKLNWRTRNNVENTIEIMQAAINAGFAAGGHRNAGGGSIEINDLSEIEKIKERLFESIRVELQKVNGF